MKAELRDITPKPPREVVVTMSEEEARKVIVAWERNDFYGVADTLGQMLRRVVEEGR